MPSVTPQRRERDGDEESERSDVDSSALNKRQRRSAESDEEDTEIDVEDDVEQTAEDDSQFERPLFPDSYRRSPKGKGRARDAHDNGQEHKPGSIVRVKLTDFVTYTNAEFHPGPNLNMVIGPNGTGKSTLVCAICLGLGWPPVHLGRAKDISEFVKHGAKKAKIEIELKADPDRHSRNPVITTIINKDGSKSAESKTQFLIDDRKSTKKAVQDLARSFSIQVDNLCQFLPQDRVVEFAALSPIDLLVETQRAAAPEEMSRWHEQLKVMRKEEKARQNDQQVGIEQLKSMEDRQKSQMVEVGRMRERTTLQERISVLHKVKPFVDYTALMKEHSAANDRRKEARKEVRVLERRTEPRRLAVAAKQEYLDQLKHVSEMRGRLLDRAEKNAETKRRGIDTTQTSLENTEQNIKAEKEANTKHKQDINKYQQEIRKLERLMASPPAEFDPSEFNETLRVKRLQKRDLEGRISGLAGQVESHAAQREQREQIITQKENEAQSLQSQAGRQTNKLQSKSRDAAVAWTWIQANRQKFTGQVYGPPMIECTVKDPKFTDAVEQAVGQSELQAFTVTNQADFKMLLNQLQHVMRLSDVNVRASLVGLDHFRPPHPEAELRALGFNCWILDVIEGPDAVLAMLCDNRNVHQTALGDQPVPESKERELERSSISAYATPSKYYQITRRREYGEGAVVTRVSALRKASTLTDAPVDTQAARRVQIAINEAQDEINQIDEEVQGMQTQIDNLNSELIDVNKDIQNVTQEKTTKQSQDTYFKGLPTKLEGFKDRLETAQQAIAEQAGKILAIKEEQDKLCQEKGQQCLDYANAVVVLRDLHVKLLEVDIMRIEAKSDLEQLKSQQTDEERLLVERAAELQRLSEQVADLRQRGLAGAAECTRIADDLTDDEGKVQEEVANWTPQKLETELVAIQAQLDSLHGGNENIIREFEQRARKIEEKRARLAEVETSLSELMANITEIRDQWEPRLDELIAQISEAFAENFAGIQCAGEVGVFKDDDFENWAIQIKVKFREDESLSILDSHRQSGGERAVSTIFYLMALQSLARAPFRVVDEINQGMDPRNERLVHSRMVDIACAEHTSQYFLITPKLLNNLKYHPNMKVHCIASGEYMPDDHRKLDFGALAKKALVVKGAAA